MKIPSTAERLSYENCALQNLFMQISVYINGMLMSTSNNISNYSDYIKFMLMTPIVYKLLRCSTIGYEYKTDTDTSNVLRNATTKDLPLAGKINDEMSNIPQWCLLMLRLI